MVSTRSEMPGFCVYQDKFSLLPLDKQKKEISNLYYIKIIQHSTNQCKFKYKIGNYIILELLCLGLLVLLKDINTSARHI